MPYTLTCPVCERPGVPVNSSSCPQCDADLICFQALESLAEKKFPVPIPVKVPQKKKNSFLSPPVLFLCLFFIFVGGYFCFYALRAQEHVNELEQQVVALQTNLQVAEREVEQTKKMVSLLPESEQIKVAQEDQEDSDTDSDTFEEDNLLISSIEDIQLAQATQDAAKDRKEKQGTAQDTKHVAHVAQTEHPKNTENAEHAGKREDIQPTVSSATVEEDNKKEVVMVASVVERPQAVAPTPGPATEQARTRTTIEQELRKESQAKTKVKVQVQELAEQEIIHKIVHKIYRGGKKAGIQASNDAKTDAKTLPVNVPVIEMVSKKKKPPLPAVLPAVSKTAQVEQTVEESAGESAGESLPVLPEKQWSKKTFLYLAKKTDTLWDLAKQFYGDGKYYPVIMELNPDLAFSHIEDDKSVRFFSDRAVLQDMYNHRIEWRQGMMLWKHKVLAGETQQIIEKRFASPRSFGRVLYDKNPLMYPGALIRIILQ